MIEAVKNKGGSQSKEMIDKSLFLDDVSFMNISTLAKILGVSINELRNTGVKENIYGFAGRNTRIPYNSAVEITRVLKPDKLSRLKNDDKIYLPASLTVNDFAEALGRPVGVIIKTLLLNGVMATLNEKIDFDTASLIAQEIGIEVYPADPDMFEKSTGEDLQLIKNVEYDTPEDKKKYVSRPPVVTIMGHVDHGKTTLLDTIRKSNIVSSEAGSITQHISSYQITYKNKKVTFVDTPGHSAFTAMRARGSQLADFIILVVSATEGVKPQTVEVIERAKLSKTPVLVAINKIDLPEADIERTKQDIAKFGLIPEEWGGEAPFIPISAKHSTNLDVVLDNIFLQAELLDLKGEIDCPGQAVIIESHLDKQLGVVSTILVTKDTLNVGDYIRCSEYVGKIRKLESSEGKNLTEAHISEPVLLVGLPEVCDIGEVIIKYKNQKDAQIAASLEKAKVINKKTVINSGITQNDDNEINVILKADVNGSLEALKESIIKIPQDQVRVNIKSESVGEINENDIEFSKTTNSTILAFNTKLNLKASSSIKNKPVSLVQSNIIYVLLEWVEESILKNVKHEVKTQILGKAEVLALFKSDKSNIQVLGGEVKEGKILSNKELKLIRSDKEIARLEIHELQKNKTKVSEVNISQQFGLAVSGKIKVQKGDYLVSFDETVVS
ncbi:MAG: translation initiation factor IF-2 [Patescibacteria group bacterium]